MASQIFGLVQLTLFRRFDRFAFIIPKYVFPDSAGYCIRRLSTSAYVTNNKSDDPNTHKESACQSEVEEDRHRSDLERLKKLLFREKSQPLPSNEDNSKPDQKKEAKRDRTKTKRIERKVPPSAVNVSKFKDILSALKRGTSLPAYEGITLVATPEPRFNEKETIDAEKSAVNVSKFKDIHSASERGTLLPAYEGITLVATPEPRLNEKETIEADKTTPSENHPQKTRESHTVDVSKINDILSVLGQDASSAPTEDVILAARHKQLSSENFSSFEGAYNIKQRQIRDRDSKEKMSRNSLRTGPRFHWFDEAKSKWSGDEQTIATTPILFQEMAEKEIRDLGMSTSTQSGFQDLIDNVHRQWAFPVDNETCKKEEENVGFDEHVFLEYLLDEFPKSGNAREFMELVITGLQQNPHLDIHEKNEHIMWFKEYFDNIPDEHVQI